MNAYSDSTIPEFRRYNTIYKDSYKDNGREWLHTAALTTILFCKSRTEVVVAAATLYNFISSVGFGRKNGYPD
jgi:hypothetical protein